MAYAGVNDWYTVQERAEALNAKGIYASMFSTYLVKISFHCVTYLYRYAEVFDKPFWEFAILKQLFTTSSTWKDQFGVPFSITVDHPCMFSFGQSLVWNKPARTVEGRWQWISHPTQIFVWKFTDLKKPPCKISIYHEQRLKEFCKKSKRDRTVLAAQKINRGFVGWKKSTLIAIKSLLELSPKKEAQVLLKYYTQCGLSETYTPQLTHLDGVTTQNLFIQYERRQMTQQIVLGKKFEGALPTRVNRHTVHCM